MQAYEFHTTAQNGFIRIPDEYAKRIGSRVRVVLYLDDNTEVDLSTERPSLMDLAGIFQGSEDMDIKEIREERRKKYGHVD